MGNVIVKSEIFVLRQDQFKNGVSSYIKLEVFRPSGRGQFYKMVITNMDIFEWTTLDFPTEKSKKTEKIQILTKFTQFLTLQKSKFYRKLFLNPKHFDRPTIQKDRISNIPRHMLLKEEDRNAFLARETHILKPICNFTIMLGSHYAITVLYRSDALNEMFLRIYIPRTKRVFQVCLHQKEFFEQNNFLVNVIKKKVSKSRIDLVKSKANFMKF